MDAKGLSDYVLSHSHYDGRVIPAALRQHGLSFVRHVFSGLKDGKLVYGSQHLDRVCDGIFRFYERDEKTVGRMDRILGKLEPRLPRYTEEEGAEMDVELARRGERIASYHARRLNERIAAPLEEIREAVAHLYETLGGGTSPEGYTQLAREIHAVQKLTRRLRRRLTP